MLDSHERILSVDKVKFGPLYDQVTVLNLATGEQTEVGAAELIPPMLKAESKSAYILEPVSRSEMYLIAMVNQIYPGTSLETVLKTEYRDLQLNEIVELLHSPLIPLPSSSCAMRCEYRDLSIFITAFTDTANIHSSYSINRYMEEAIEQDPEILKMIQEHVAEEYANGQTEEE